MNKRSCLHGSERYEACDDEAYQRGENAGKISGQERHSGTAARKNNRLNSNHVKSAKKLLFLCCCHYQ